MDGRLYAQPIQFDTFLQEYHLNEDLHTLYINPTELMQLQDMLPQVIHFGHMLYMDQKQQELQQEMEKKMENYKQKMDTWHTSRSIQLQLEFEDMPEYGFIKRRRKDKEHRIKTILDTSSRYFQDLTSLKGDPYLKLIAVFYNK